MFRVILVDDERPALEELNYIIGRYRYAEVLACYTNAVEAMNAIRMEEPDLVFLDIDMPELNGLQMAEEILKLGLKTKVVFATAYDEHALEAFKKNAIDYLLKPYEEERVYHALKKMKDMKEQQMNYEQLMQIKQGGILKSNTRRLPIWKDDRIYFICVEDILFCQIDGREIQIHTKDELYRMTDTLSNLEQKLPEDQFFKTHRAYIVNISKVVEVSPYFNHTLMIKLEGSNDEIPVSRSNVKAFKERLEIA